MASGARGQKDSAMAANLRKSPGHTGVAVERRKASRLAALLASLSGSLTGTAAYRRRMQKK